MDAVILFFRDGGFFMIPIGILLLIGTAIIFERLYMILFVYSANGASLMQKVQRLVLDNNISDAVKLCNSRKKAGIYQVFKAALLNTDRPFEEIQDHVEVATLAVVPKLQNRMPYLFTIANVATLLGLLGTIIGLIKTFAAVGAVEGSQKQILLSAGISTAMNTTAFGLIVAVPCMLCYGFLFNRINNMIDEIEHFSARLLMLIRTGTEYFENFSTDGLVTTEQTPKNPSQKKGKKKAGIPKKPKNEVKADQEEPDYTEEESEYREVPEDDSEGNDNKGNPDAAA